ncbi:MAG: response regulator [Candidatus Zixiibacteriota bacterium]
MSNLNSTMKIRILLVDDEEKIINMLSRHFRFKGYEVYIAKNGREALEQLEQIKIDIIISDIKMPILSGIDLLRSVRRHYPMIHVIMITGYVTLDNVLACMRLGADSCIFKPFEDMDELDEAVDYATKNIKQWLDVLNTLADIKKQKEAV